MIGLEPIWKNSEGFSYYSMSPQPRYALQSGLCLCHDRSFRQVVYSLYTFNTTPVVYLARRSLNSSPNQPPFIWNFRLHMLYFYVVKIKFPCVCLFHHIPMVAPARFELTHTDLKGRRVYHFTKTPQLMKGIVLHLSIRLLTKDKSDALCLVSLYPEQDIGGTSG